MLKTIGAVYDIRLAHNKMVASGVSQSDIEVGVLVSEKHELIVELTELLADMEELYKLRDDLKFIPFIGKDRAKLKWIIEQSENMLMLIRMRLASL